MSIKTNAEQIRDETALGANTATRVGGNLVEIADDLVIKETAIDANTAAAATNATAIAANAALIATNASSAATNAAAAAANAALIATNSAAIAANATAASTNATAAATNATAILTKIGNDGSPIAVATANALTGAAYTALATKVATRLYFTT